MALVVVGVDPGLSTGVAGLHNGENRFVVQLPPIAAMIYLERWMREWHTRRYTVIVGVEKFTITQRTARLTQQQDAVEVTGIVRFLCDRYEAKMFQEGPSVAKKMISNPLLKRLGLWTPPEPGWSDADDANDAMRQALTCLAKHRPSAFDDLLSRGTIRA